MLQQDEPDDYVIATGETHSIEELVQRAFAEVGIDDWRRYVRQDPKFLRPAEVDLLIGDATKARTKLGWEPEVDFPALVKMMVAHDLRLEATKAGIQLPGSSRRPRSRRFRSRTACRSWLPSSTPSSGVAPASSRWRSASANTAIADDG